MDKIMAIYDSDVIYATHFMEYFRKRTDFDFNLTVFSRRESLEEFLKASKIEILLLGSEIEFDMADQLNIQVKYIYRLAENKLDIGDEGFPSIFKYQNAQSVMKELLTDYNRRENETRVSRKAGNVRILSIYSPLPDVGSLLFAWSLSLNQASKHKILLIPLEYFPVALFSFEEQMNQSISEVIYYLKDRNPNTISKMMSYLQYSGNLSYLTGLTHGFDLLSISKEDIQYFTEQLKSYTDFQTIIFYSGIYTEAISELLIISDKVFIVAQDNLYSRQVLKEWERQADLIGTLKDSGKFEKISLKTEDMKKLPLTIQDLQSSDIWMEASAYDAYL